MQDKTSHYKTLILTLLAISFIVLMCAYAIGVFDSDKIVQVEEREYALGGYAYTGGTLNGLFSGHGEIEFEDGSSYSGGFSSGRFQGEGIFSNTGEAPSDNWSFIGVFQNGQPVRGTFYFSDGAVIELED